jgi:hypothetical protein
MLDFLGYSVSRIGLKPKDALYLVLPDTKENLGDSSDTGFAHVSHVLEHVPLFVPQTYLHKAHKQPATHEVDASLSNDPRQKEYRYVASNDEARLWYTPRNRTPDKVALDGYIASLQTEAHRHTKACPKFHLQKLYRGDERKPVCQSLFHIEGCH